jgi:hypothetical protein
MALADIQKKAADERKREKRLVHLTNALTRDFLDSKVFKAKTKPYKNNADYVTKSLLDFLFFEEKKEIKELNDTHIHNFMLEYVPRRLTFTQENAKDVPDIVSKFLIFIEDGGHISNGKQLTDVVKGHKREFLRVVKVSKTTGKRAPKTAARKATKKTTAKTPKIDVRVGRNDPCPCGSGKKYKKCCGISK